MPIADLELNVQRDTASYLVTVRLAPADGNATSTLATHVPMQLDWSALLEVAHDPDEYGKRLTGMLFADERLSDAWREARSFAHGARVALRVRLRLDAGTNLHSIGWETLRDPVTQTPLALDQQVLLSRYLDAPDLTPIAVPDREDLTALVVAAAPSDLAAYDLPPIDVPTEVALVTAALDGIPTEVLPSAEPVHRSTLTELISSLQRNPSVLYIVAHGSFENGQPFLWLEHDDGSSHRVAGAELAQRIAALPHRPLLIVLATCEGAGLGHDDHALAAIGPLLARVGVGAVLAVQGKIAQASVRQLMPPLFRELRRDGQIDRAVAAARTALHESPDWWRPALFMRMTDGMLFAAPRSPLPWDRYRESLLSELRREPNQFQHLRFVPQQVRALAPKETIVDIDSDDAERAGAESVINVLGRERAQLLLGLEGSGKTTLLRHVVDALTSPESSAPGVFPALGRPARPVPFLIEAERLLASNADNFVASLAVTAERVMGVSVTPEMLSAELATEGQILIAIDGMDTLLQGERARALKLLRDLATTYQRVLFLVVTRPSFDDPELSTAGFARYLLLDYNVAQFSQFLAKQLLVDARIEALLRLPLVRQRAISFQPGQDWQFSLRRSEETLGAVDAEQHLLKLLAINEPSKAREYGSARSNLIAIIGLRPHGETKLLRSAQRRLADDILSRGSDVLPIYIGLKPYERLWRADYLVDAILETARTEILPLGRLTLVDLLAGLFQPGSKGKASERVRCIFFIDGFDLLPATQQTLIAQELALLSQRLPGQTFVISASQSTFPSQLLPSAYVLLLRPLAEKHIAQYFMMRSQHTAHLMFQRFYESRLLSLVQDPALLEEAYDLLVDNPVSLTRNQVLQRHFDRTIATLPAHFVFGDIVQNSLVELAWQMRWGYHASLPLNEVFALLSTVRGDREYNLEELFTALLNARLLTMVGSNGVRFALPALKSYLAALALAAHPEMTRLLKHVISACHDPERISWWEDVVYAFASLVTDPTLLFEQLAIAIQTGSATHALLAARCLEAVPDAQEARIPAELRRELIDACVLHMRVDREPSPERREAIISALGRLNVPAIRHELWRVLVEKVRMTPSGPRYEFANIRIAAARALRHIYLSPRPETQQQTESAPAPLSPSDSHHQASLVSETPAAAVKLPSLAQIRNELMVTKVMGIWRKGPDGRDEFRDLLLNSPLPPERAIAAFAIGDMADTPTRKAWDARLLLQVIVSPDDTQEREISEDWEDTMWAAADALILCEPEHVLLLLRVIITRNTDIPDSAAQQLAYLAGRLRATDPAVVEWLIKLLIVHPSQTIKAAALGSLAMISLPLGQHRLDLPDGRPGPTIKDVIQDIAADRQIHQLALGTFQVHLRYGDDNSPLLLRRQALEALGWTGDAETLRDLEEHVSTWPVELREAWYISARQIRSRLRKA